MTVKHWPSCRLGDLVHVIHGWPFKGELFSDRLSGRPIVINIGNFDYFGGFRFANSTLREYRGEYPREYELVPGDILVVMTCQTAGGEILGIPGEVPDDGRIYLHNQRMGRLQVLRLDLIDRRWLYWLFITRAFNRYLAVTASGTKILHTSPSRIEDYRFELPPLAEQTAAAEVLDFLQGKIDLNRRMNGTLEAIARALFRSWFVDFDPVRAKAEGRQPFGMDAATAALFPDAFEDSALGEIPAGWRVGCLGDVAENPRQVVQPRDVDADLAYIGLEHMPQGSIALDDWGTAVDVESAKSRFSEGDFLFGKLRPYFKKVGPAPVSGICSTDILVVRAKRPEWRSFVGSHLWSDALIDAVTASSNGTRMPRASWSDIARYRVALPPEHVSARFDAQVDAMLKLIHSHIFESRTLAGLRDTLLPKLLSGEVRVREAAAALA